LITEGSGAKPGIIGLIGCIFRDVLVNLATKRQEDISADVSAKLNRSQYGDAPGYISN
jgi:hypothetical protein